MNFFGRQIPFLKLPALAGEAMMMIPPSLAFRDLSAVWSAYLKRISPSGNVIQFRDGMSAWLSDNPHDAITLMVIFCKKEYGRINPGALVVDIGANIGMFSLYAVRSGANRLLAFEPNPSSHRILVKNLSQSTIETNVSLYQLAVSGSEGETVYLPSNSSPYNKTVSAPSDASDYVSVQTTSLDKIVEQCEGRRIDYLKLDCCQLAPKQYRWFALQIVPVEARMLMQSVNVFLFEGNTLWSNAWPINWVWTNH